MPSQNLQPISKASAEQLGKRP